MSCKTEVALAITVDDKELKEYHNDGKIYVEANLNSPVSYTIEEENEDGLQRYPVTPFKVKGFFNNRMSTPCYLRLTIDGQQVWMKPFAPHQSGNYRVTGFRCGNEVRELLFTLPKLTSEIKKSDRLSEFEKQHLGTIKLEVIEGIHCGTYETWKKQTVDFHRPGDISDRPGLRQAYKKEVSEGLATRDGRMLGESRITNCRIRMQKYMVGKKHYGEIVIHYRTREQLQDIGIHEDSWNKNHNTRSIKQNKKEKGKSKSEENKRNGQNEMTNSHAKTDIKNKEDVNEDICVENFSKISMKDNLVQTPTKIFSPSGKYQSKSGYAREKLGLHTPSVNEKSSDLIATEKLGLHTPSVNEKTSDPIATKKLGLHTPSVNEKSSDPIKTDKLGVHTPSEKKKLPIPSIKIKRELFDVEMMELEEGKEFRYMEVDDDVYILEEVDDDVVWMGDDSCCFIDVDDPEIPMVDLCTE